MSTDDTKLTPAPPPRTGDETRPAVGRSSGYDGPTLRAVRESLDIPLRRIARTAGMSHGHLSKVERGEYGRPVTPAIIAAYERTTGVSLAEATAAIIDRGGKPTVRRGKIWRPGELTDMRRRAYNAAIAALTIGGHLGEPYGRLLDSTGRPLTPAPPDTGDVAQLRQVTELVTALDLRYGGGLVSQLGKALLRWSVIMLDAMDIDQQVSRDLHAVIGALAARCAWSAFDTSSHEAARSLFRLALYAAGRAGDPDLRAHILADVAAQHNYLGYNEDSLEIVRFAEGDERITPGVRMVLHGVKARAYGAISEPALCRHHIGHAEQAYHDADPDTPGWVGRLRHPARLAGMTGQAMAALARTTGAETDRREALDRLTQAVDGYDPTTHGRAHALCTTRLAILHLDTGNPEQATRWARLALAAAGEIYSARLYRDLGTIRTLAADRDEPPLGALVADIDALTGSSED
jgi:transcriptional regulator with XRE-family HTH domain